MAKKNNKFHLRDIILLALVGIIFGVIYWAAAFIYNALTIVFTPLKLPMMGNDLTMGLWCMAGPMAGFMLKKPGAPFLGEFLGAAGEALIGDQWGAANLISGAVQGIASELGFTFTGYKHYDWLGAVSTTITTTIVTFAWDWFRNGYNKFGFKNVYYFSGRLLSMFIFCGVLVMLIERLLERSHVMKREEFND